MTESPYIDEIRTIGKADFGMIRSRPSLVSNVKSEWMDVVRMFSERMPDMKPRRVAMMLAPIWKKEDVYLFHKRCSNARNFSAFFLWSLSPRNIRR